MTLTVTEKVIFNSKIITRFKIAVRKAEVIGIIIKKKKIQRLVAQSTHI